ncbi:unnamed protein product [Vitrella brassicaformis CCMP3155]|uniref:P-loop containing nucleoside triphosphate hydrolase protein n=3 Tax=Vitrella brassicaformis TaxID=1169539 RepID=A0A0G4EVB5_VITBC|nr:unnamed protein product [Vitrella brassicaformis CCMP3155]|eukprot:CEM02561.1 unnamed protein product [Vitrella brassicaformis CCMP3155]
MTATAPVDEEKASSRHPVPPLNHKSPWPSLLSFAYSWKMINVARRKVLDKEDLPQVAGSDEAARIGAWMEDAWREECARSDKPNVLRMFVRKFCWWFICLAALQLCEVAAYIGVALIVGELLGGLSDPTASLGYLMTCASTLLLLGLLLNITHHHVFHEGFHFGMRLRVAAMSLAYNKVLRLSLRALTDVSAGQIMNMFSSDFYRMEYGGPFFQFVATSPIHLLVVLVIVYQKIGPASLIGISLLVLLLPAQMVFSSLFVRFRRRTVAEADRRVRTMGELISGIRVLKLYSWEEPLAERVAHVRNREIRALRRSMNLKAVNLWCEFLSSAVIVSITFTVYVLMGNTLTPALIFSTYSLFLPLQLTLTLFFPYAVEFLSELYVATQRLTALLTQSERSTHKRHGIANGNGCTSVPSTDSSDDTQIDTPTPTHHHAIDIHNMTASWEPKTGPVLKSVSLSVKQGELLVIAGPVGGGKTSLLMTILGELEPQAGGVCVREGDGMALVEQEPFIAPVTILENILFGKPADQALVDAAIHASALATDLASMPSHVHTQVGERGVTLSGGQKARVAMARAIYAAAITRKQRQQQQQQGGIVVLLDDPLSAVDANVARHLVAEALLGALADTTRILVTHQVSVVAQMCPQGRLVVLNDGCVVHDGVLGDVAHMPHLLMRGDVVRESEKEAQLEEIHLHEISLDDMADNEDDGNNNSSEQQKPAYEHSCSVLKDTNEEGQEEASKGAIIEAETRQTGTVSWGVFRTYASHMGPWWVICVMCLLAVGAQVMLILSGAYLSQWSQLDNEQQTQPATIGHYWLLVLFLLIFSVSRAHLFFALCLRASQSLHNTVFAKLLSAPMRWFEANPTGRILNRFSKDVSLMDDMVPYTGLDVMQCSLRVLGTVVFVCVVNPVVVVPLIPLAAVCVWLRRVYLRSSRELRRLDGVARSPLYSQLTTTLHGLATLRAFELHDDSRCQFEATQDMHNSAYWTYKQVERWFGFRLDVVVSVFQAITAIGAVAMRQLAVRGREEGTWLGGLEKMAADPGLLGLGLVYIIQMASLFQWTARQSAELTNFMTSVERIIEYARLPQERQVTPAEEQTTLTRAKKTLPHPSPWPSDGVVAFNDVVLRYRDHMPTALKGVSFSLRPREKIGIVGRSGAGKTSLIAALFRLSEIEGGSVTIDGVDSRSLRLRTLRSSISIIPQSPVIFAGSLRANLDPFNEHSDDAVWGALKAVQLEGVANKLTGGLMASLTEAGDNFSVGEKQLVCLARALLRETRILVLDEATANVDTHTDFLIQHALRNHPHFQKCVVLTIAHRLSTVIDADRVLVMDRGAVVEFDSPAELLRRGDGDGYFRRLVDRTGMGERLRVLACEAERKRAGEGEGEGQGRV